MRFWGKIKGTKADYYIVEAIQEGGEAGEEEGAADTEIVEPRGTGANQFVYWVCTSPLKQWTQLKDIKPSQIVNSRKIKFNFSGDINKKIYTNPFFFETEKIYLRAQISRINSSTTIVPKGLHKFVEDNTREIEDNIPEDGGESIKPSTR